MERKKRPWEEIEFAKSKQASAPSDKSLHDFTIKLNSHFCQPHEVISKGVIFFPRPLLPRMQHKRLDAFLKFEVHLYSSGVAIS